MTSPLRIAVLGAWHVHAEGYGRATLDHPETELIAVWDDDAERGSAMAEELGVEFAPELEQLLGRSDLDGVTVTVATSDHDAVIGKAISAGKHVFTEKLLSPTVAGCDELIRAADDAGVVLTVSLPRLSRGYTRALKVLLDSGGLGRITYSRVRLAHSGAIADSLPARFYDPGEAIGGAFFDLGAHPVYLTQLILGDQFSSVTATFTDMTGRGVEDNASVTVTTADGAIGVIETGFVNPASPFTIEVHGTAGSVLYGFDGSRMQWATRKEWTEIALPENGPGPFREWIDAIHDDTRTTENLERARALTDLVAAVQAAH
ncbi:Gfo/Idh/MocA family oxidoreductase [Actinopolymorpha pittospori]